MSKPLYKDIKELQAKIDQYYKDNELVAPRKFRIYLGVSKSLLSKWKTNQPEYFNLIKHNEDKILAEVEEIAIYGAVHPKIRNLFTKTNFNKEGIVSSREVKFNQVGAIMTLRAYDELYRPETIQHKQEDKEPIVIQFKNTAPHQLPHIGNTGAIQAEVKENDTK